MNSAKYVLPLVACFLLSCKQENYFAVVANVQPADAGTVAITPTGGTVLEGTSVSFKATPKGDYVFSGWSGTLSGTENPTTFTVTSDVSVTAYFTLRDYPLTHSVEGEGTIVERVVSTKADYASGTVVELTAVPDVGWSFDHWEGDLKGSDNPSQITVSSAKNVKAVFTKIIYDYNLTIIGPGVVDENRIDTKSSLDHGSKVNLKAIPAKGAVFLGWSGSASGSSSEIEVDINNNTQITATFSLEAQRCKLPDLKSPWSSIRSSYMGLDTSILDEQIIDGGWLYVDYNRDGILDLVTFLTYDENNTASELPVYFYIGQPDGGYVEDQKNRGIIATMPRKPVYADFNDDGYPDLLLTGHGAESIGTKPGSVPMILMSSTTGEYNLVKFNDLFGYYHGCTTGDFDNDGDVDIILPDAMNCITHVLRNNGDGLFSIQDDVVVPANGIFTCELRDIDHDGNLDLLWGGSLVDGKWDDGFWRAKIIWGDGMGFTSTNRTSTILASDRSLEMILDACYHDINGDGIDEIIASTTTAYKEWAIEVYELINDSFADVTDHYFDREEAYGNDGRWLGIINIEEIENELFLIAQPYVSSKIYYKGGPGGFSRINEKGKIKPIHGFVIYVDVPPIEIRRPFWEDNEYHYTDNTYSGESCIQLKGNGSAGPVFNLGTIKNGTDLSFLMENDYSLELFLRSEGNTGGVEFMFLTDETEEIPGNAFSYYYKIEGTVANGEWFRLSIPLTKFESQDKTLQNPWRNVGAFFIYPSSELKEFYIDDIRIRKTID